MPRHQFTIFVEDAQEYAAAFTSCRRHFGKQKMGTSSLDHNKNTEKSQKKKTFRAATRSLRTSCLLERTESSRSLKLWRLPLAILLVPLGNLSSWQSVLIPARRSDFQDGPARLRYDRRGEDPRR
jgi:hypothetical protein